MLTHLFCKIQQEFNRAKWCQVGELYVTVKSGEDFTGEISLFKSKYIYNLSQTIEKKIP